MEKHRCRLCLRKFANGRALGGHMRSHMMNLHVPPKREELQQRGRDVAQKHQQKESSDEEFESGVQLSTSSSQEEEEQENKRNSEKKNKGLADPDESCFAVGGGGGGSVVLQDGESETESSKNQTCRRSKRVRKSRISDTHNHQCYFIDAKLGKANNNNNESASYVVEPEPVSSISETSPEEDVAYCLMMLSRDKWRKEEEEEEEEEEEKEETERFEEEELDDDKSEDLGVVKVTRARSTRGGKYRCETCNKVFRSYQALGGHRASHKKIKVNASTEVVELENATAARDADNIQVVMEEEEKSHECPICYRVFASGQALGGHKRSHFANNPAAATANANVTIDAKPFSRMIDLNLPAPLEEEEDDDEISQMEVSAVSDAEFVNPIRVLEF